MNDSRPSQRSTNMTRFFTMFALVMAGEAIFGLPFLVARIFRPTLLDVFGITNLQLGTAFSVYGVVAMLAYFPGGALADRFSARMMMTGALAVSALGGIYYATVPSVAGLKLLFGFWGLTTILFFWAAMIRATRVWGGAEDQGKAFGILDGGRGLLAAVLASGTVALFWGALTRRCSLGHARAACGGPQTGHLGLHRDDGLRGRGGVGLRAQRERPAGLGWSQWALVVEHRDGAQEPGGVASGHDRGDRLHRVQGHGRSGPVRSRCVRVRRCPGSQRERGRVLGAAIRGAGLIADKVGGPRTIAVCFFLIILGDGVVALGLLDSTAPWMLFTMVIAISATVFGLRGIYFAIFDEAGVPAALTGTPWGWSAWSGTHRTSSWVRSMAT